MEKEDIMIVVPLAAIAFVQGIVVVFGLYLIELIVGAFAPGFSFPFSVWWGMLATLPGLGMAAWILKTFRELDKL